MVAAGNHRKCVSRSRKIKDLGRKCSLLSVQRTKEVHEKCRDQRWARAGVSERSSEEPRGVSWAEGKKRWL